MARSWLSVAITIRKYFHRSNTANKAGIGHPVATIYLDLQPRLLFSTNTLVQNWLALCDVMLINLRCQIMIMNCNNVKWAFYMEESLSLCLISLSLNPHQTLQIIILRWSLANDADKFPQVLISNLIKSTGTRELVVVVVVVGTHRR